MYTTPIQNNNTMTNTNTSAATLLQPNPSSPTSLPASSPNTPAETRPTLSHPASAISAHHQSFVTKNSTPPVTLRLRREMTQPTLSRAELVSSMDFPLEKIATNDNFPLPYRSNISSTKSNLTSQSDLRCKQIKIVASRLSAEYVPVRQISRSRVNDALPSPKGKRIIFFLFILFFSTSEK